MSFTRQNRVPPTPTLPQGEAVARYGTYLEAQKAVDHLADAAFPVQLVTIVGTDLRMVERVTGRLSYPRVALAGAASGMWFGLFVGLLLWLVTAGSSTPPPLLAAILIGAAFGMLFSVIAYSLSRGRRDFTSQSQIVAASYAVLCAADQAHKARNLLQSVGGVVSGWPERVVTPVPPPPGPQDQPPVPAPQPPVSQQPAPPSDGATPPQPSTPPFPGEQPRA